MKKIKITEEQLSLLQSPRKKLVKITESQLKRIGEEQQTQPKTVKAKSLFESKSGSQIVEMIVGLLEDVFKNPSMIGEDLNPILKEAGIKPEELFEVLNDQAIKKFVETKYENGSKTLSELNNVISGKLDEVTASGGLNADGNDFTYAANAFGSGPLNPNDDKNMPKIKKGTEVKVVAPGQVAETSTNPNGVLEKKKDGTYKKVSKADANYRKSDDTLRKCSICSNHTKGKCKNVMGEVKPNMVCDGFEKKKIKESMSKNDLIIESLAKRTGKTIDEIKEIIKSKK